MYIFNFHHVEPIPRMKSRAHITMTPQGLARFIRVIRRVGLEPVSLKDVLNEGFTETDRRKQVILTFDDGYENFYEYAAPILTEEHCPATVFVLAGKFSGCNDWDASELGDDGRDRLMSRAQIQALSKSPYITVGSHGMWHQHYAALSKTDLAAEISESYEILSAVLGNAFLPVLAYPWGEYSSQVVELMADSGYALGFTTDSGGWEAGTCPYRIPRYSIYYRDGNPLRLFAKLCAKRILV